MEIVSRVNRLSAGQIITRVTADPSSLASSTSTSVTRRRLNVSCLSMYDVPPQNEVTLREFERSAFDRLQLLKHFEEFRAKRVPGATGGSLSAIEATEDLNLTLKKYQLYQDPDRDNLGHHVLRLAYCMKEDTRRWFVTLECALFRSRFENETDDVVKEFLAEYNLDYSPIKVSDMQIELLDKLRAVSNHENSRVYYRIPFESAFDLLRDRRVYLESGFAYISRHNLVHIVLNHFRSNLSRHMAATFRFMQSNAGRGVKDERIQPLLSSLAKQTLAVKYNPTSIEGNVTREQLPQLAASPAFPLCMSHLYNSLRQEHHLKHGGRMQLGLFLKGIGLSLADALLFWRQSFSRRTPAEKFEKEYAYNIRHNYGKEGKRANYTAYSCSKIINSSPAIGDHHGCPFRHNEDTSLRQMLRLRSIDKESINEIMNLVDGGHYQIACKRLFTVTHNGQVGDEVGNHPNAYFDSSRRIEREKGGVERGVVKVEGIKVENGVKDEHEIKEANYESKDEKIDHLLEITDDILMGGVPIGEPLILD